MGCAASSISQQELRTIHVKTKGKVADKDIVFWHKLWRKIAPSGKMSRDQFVEFVVNNNIGTGLANDALSMFKLMDGDKSGFVEFDEFVMILALPRSHEEMTPEEFSSLCIAIYDENEDGVISEEELLRFATTKAKREDRLDEEFQSTIKEIISRLVKSIDVNGDGMLTSEEITKAINRDPDLKRIL